MADASPLLRKVLRRRSSLVPASARAGSAGCGAQPEIGVPPISHMEASGSVARDDLTPERTGVCTDVCETPPTVQPKRVDPSPHA